ncbi:MAG: S-layer homology domain-containing protein, partial [Clostridia bacterium]|nr:S-layer homology domain-containing protein [Clostridia bacterium]
MSKQIISLVTAFLILFQLTPALAFSDTDGTEYEQAVYVLSELDIVGGYEDKTFRPAEGISRAEFAAMVVRMLDTSIYSISEEVVFKDVSKKHWAFEYVNAGYSIGYFSGYGDGTFNPEEKISFNEIVKTMVTILGYKPIAEAKGGYPSGYITVANELDILDGLSLGSSAYVTRGDVALLLYNCLDKPRLEQTGFGSDKIDYAEDERRTILTDELKVKRYEGVVTATRNTGIYTEAALGTDEILMGDTKLAIGKSDISAYLGYNLVVYAKEEAKTLKDTVLFYEINEENEITTVTADDIDPSTDLGTFCYWVDDEQEKI